MIEAKKPAILQTWTPAPDREEKLAAIRRAAKAILALDAHSTLKRDLLNTLVWGVTCVDGKMNVRYRSTGALGLDGGSVRHEHVQRRKTIVARILANPDDVESALESAVACIVTAEEHVRLSHVDRSLEGWDRYRAAGVAVIDALTWEPLDLGP